MSDEVFTCLTMIRGDEDIAYASLTHHCELGFDRLILISHVTHGSNRSLVDNLRLSYPELEIIYFELHGEENFSRRKGPLVNRCLEMFLDKNVLNYIYCFDADEFLNLGSCSDIKSLVSAVKSISSSASRGDLYLQLPWFDLVADKEIPFDGDLFSFHRFAATKYNQLADVRGSKVFFQYLTGRRVHMGYHWILDASGKVEASAESKELIKSLGVSVLHLPFRSSVQFVKRLEVYLSSALPTEKYNLFVASVGSENYNDIASRVFGFCPCFESPQAVARHYEIPVEVVKSNKIFRFLYLARSQLKGLQCKPFRSVM